MKKAEVASFLEEKASFYNHPKFIETDPIQIPRKFHLKEDIEIAAFLVASFAWGNRKSIITNGEALMKRMGNSPYDFVLSFSQKDKQFLEGFVHRTFNENDLVYFIQALQYLYKRHQGLENVFTFYQGKTSTTESIIAFRELFFSLPHLQRIQKHVSNPLKNSACKRIHMFLRWMVRDDQNGVDFGLWKGIPPSKLSCPLDVHSGRVARKLKLLKRAQNDGKALLELDQSLRKIDSKDPVKFDFALFGLGVFEGF